MRSKAPLMLAALSAIGLQAQTSGSNAPTTAQLKKNYEREMSLLPATVPRHSPQQGNLELSRTIDAYRIKPEPPKPREWVAVLFPNAEGNGTLHPNQKHADDCLSALGLNHKTVLVREVLP